MRAFVNRHAAPLIALALAIGFGMFLYAVHDSAAKRRSACQDVESLKTIQRNEKQASLATTRKYLLELKRTRRKHPDFKPPFKRSLIIEQQRAQRRVIAQLAAKDC